MSDTERNIQEAAVHDSLLQRRFGGAALSLWPDLGCYLKDQTTVEAVRETDETESNQHRT